MEGKMSTKTTLFEKTIATPKDPKGGGSGPGGTVRLTEELNRAFLKRRSFPGVEKLTKRRRWKSLPRTDRKKKKKGKSSGVAWKRTDNRTNTSAPFNSTQFLMSDHGGETIQYLDTTLEVRRSLPSSERGEESTIPVREVARARESSFSLDFDEDFYYSSPEDEEEFVSQEFIKEYNSARTDRLVDMSKADLIQEYLQMEQRVDSLEKRLKRHKGKEDPTEKTEETDSNNSDSNDIIEQIRLFQKEILRLEAENERLRIDNVYLVQHKKRLMANGSEDDDDSASTCSTCSSSSSCSSSTSSDSSSSNGEEGDEEIPSKQVGVDASTVLHKTDGGTKSMDLNERDDTGYESSHSASNAKMKQVRMNEELVSSTSNN